MNIKHVKPALPIRATQPTTQPHPPIYTQPSHPIALMNKRPPELADLPLHSTPILTTLSYEYTTSEHHKYLLEFDLTFRPKNEDDTSDAENKQLAFALFHLYKNAPRSRLRPIGR